MKIIDFTRKGNVVRFYLGEDNLENWYGEAKGGLHDIYIAEIKQAWIKE